MADERLIDILLEWEDARARGDSIDPARLCRDAPDLIDEVRRRIAGLGSLDRVLAAPEPDWTPVDAESAIDTTGTSADSLILDQSLTDLRFHARGGLGEVYKGFDRLLNRPVAVKLIQSRFRDFEPGLQRFAREAAVTARLDHPGVVPVHAAGRHVDGRPCYVMRFISGQTLHDAVTQLHANSAEPWPAREFRQLLGRFVAVCAAVAYAHNRGILHRDLKPANVMLGEFGETLVVDWGLAKPIGDCKLQIADLKAGSGSETCNPQSEIGDLTLPGQVIGTPAYMSPDQAAGADVGPASDVYGLGATLYAILTGGPPFTGTTVSVLDDARAGRWKSPRVVRPGVPAALDAICRKAMAVNVWERYASAGDLAGDVENWLADEPVTAWKEPARVRARRWARKHGRVVTGVVAAVGVGVIALAVLAVANDRSRRAIAGELDRAAAARTRTRQALDDMVSEATPVSLGRQAELTADQRKFLTNAPP